MNIRNQLDNVLKQYIVLFSNKHEVLMDFEINRDLLDVLCFGDYYLHITDIIFDIDNNVNKELFFAWYSDTLDFTMENGIEKAMNYQSYVKGLRYEMLKN